MSRMHYANTRDSDMFYVVGGSISDPFFFLEKEGRRTIFLNALEIGAFRERHTDIEALPIEKLQKKTQKLGKLAYAILADSELLGSEIEVSRRFPLDVADYLRSKDVVLNVRTPFMPERAIKSADEIQNITNALKTTCEAFKLIENILHDTQIYGNSLLYRKEILTSEFIKSEVGLFLYKNGMDDPEGMIISSGAQAAMPHHKGAGPIRPNETIVCDLFPKDRENGYFADMTRTYVKGVPSPHAAKMYEAVKLAQDKAFELIRPGVQARNVHNAAAKAIKSAGFEVGTKGFIHSLGHGLGIDVHESPSISGSSEHILEVGNVIAIEPGLYYPEFGGVRLEDVVVVTSQGFENLTKYQRDFVIK